MTVNIRSLPYKLIKVEPRELPAAAVSFLFAFTLMASYYLLRPVRDAMSSDWTDAELSWLWTLNFFISTAAVLVYGWVVSRVPLKRLVPGIYLFFALSFLLFYAAAGWLPDTGIVDQAFYVWVSFFALFHISVFWSFTSDIYTRAQAKRLFGLFGAGASIGAIAGPALTVALVENLGVYNLLLIAAMMLVLLLPMILFLERSRVTAAGQGQPQSDPLASIGGNLLGGFRDFISHRFLLGIGLFILLYTLMSTFVYFELKNAMAEYDRAARSQYWGLMDLAVNTLAILTALFATGRLATRWGLALTLALVPMIMVFGWLAVAVAPGLMALIGLQIVRRAGNYAITKPGREMLFTGVERDTRYKTKPVIDIVVYRGGDVAAGWTYTALAQGVGLGLGAIALAAAALAVGWALLGVFLGNRHDRAESAAPKSALLTET